MGVNHRTRAGSAATPAGTRNKPAPGRVDHTVTTPIEIQVFSDLTCPWCFIGKTRLENAMEIFATDPNAPAVTVVYKSFRIAPTVPTDFAGSTDDYLREYEGMPAGHVQAVLDHVTAAGLREGIAYDFGRVRQTNSGRAHQLVQFAKSRGLQGEMVERVYRAFFVDGENISDLDTLAGLAAEVGLDRSEALAALTAGDFERAVSDDEARAGEFGIGAVPFYVINDAVGVSGAQERDAFLEILRRVSAGTIG